MNFLYRHFVAVALTLATLATGAEKTITKSKKASRKAAAHVHGSSELSLIASANDFSVSGALPMDDVAGFERAPRSEAERAILKDAIDLIKAGKLVAPENTDCKLSDPKVFVDPAFDQSITHYELDVDLAWHCSTPVVAIKVEGFNSFKNINSLKFSVLNQGKQTALSVKRSDQKTSITLPKK